MLLELTRWLAHDIRGFNVFNYITLRAVLATLTALAISFIAGPSVIRKLTEYKVGQAVRDDGPQSHLLTKKGTPTMGGVLILLGIAISTLIWADLSNRFIWIVLIVTLNDDAMFDDDDEDEHVHLGANLRHHILLVQAPHHTAQPCQASWSPLPLWPPRNFAKRSRPDRRWPQQSSWFCESPLVQSPGWSVLSAAASLISPANY